MTTGTEHPIPDAPAPALRRLVAAGVALALAAAGFVVWGGPHASVATVTVKGAPAVAPSRPVETTSTGADRIHAAAAAPDSAPAVPANGGVPREPPTASSPSAPPTVATRLEDRQVRRLQALEAFGAPARSELQRCFGGLPERGLANVLVTFRRDNGQPAVGRQRFLPVNLAVPGTVVDARTQQCLDALKNLPMSLDAGDGAEEETFSQIMNLPVGPAGPGTK